MLQIINLDQPPGAEAQLRASGRPVWMCYVRICGSHMSQIPHRRITVEASEKLDAR